MIENKSTQVENNGFVTNTRLVTAILAITAIGLSFIAIAVGLSGDNPVTVWVVAIGAVIDLVCLFLALRGITLPGRIVVPLILIVAAGTIAYIRGGLYHIAIAGFPVIVVFAGLLLGTKGAFFFASLAAIESMIIGYADINGLLPFSMQSRTGYDDVVVAITLNFATAIVLRAFINQYSTLVIEAGIFGKTQETANIELRKLQSELEERVAERTGELNRRALQLKRITELSEALSVLTDLKNLLSTITNIISDQFGFYHVGLFLLDAEKQFAVLQAANSDGGKRMLERGHRLKIGTGVVGFSAQNGQARIALDVGDDAVFFDNPDLPDTRSEVALPLRSRGVVIGVLDVQSTIPNAFAEEDLQILTTLANQVAISIENIRLLSETREALSQVQGVYDEFTRMEWSRAITSAGQPGFRFNAGRIEIVDKEYSNADLATAKETGQIVKIQSSDSMNKKPALIVPVKLRGEVIGLLHIESNDGNKEWLDDEVGLVEAVAERAVFAMENARLFQDARRRAAKEQLISQATAKIGNALNIENILLTTAEELENVLGGSEVFIRFQNKETE